MEIKTVMDDDTALLELIGLTDFFEIDEGYEESIKDSLLPVVKAGRLYLDENQKRVIYKFKRPIELENSSMLAELKFKNPTADDAMRVNKGITAKVGENGSTEVDLGMIMEKTIKGASIISGQAVGVLSRMSRNDMATLQAVLSFF